MKLINFVFLWGLVCLSTAQTLGQTKEVLFLGNSYTGTNNLPNLIRGLAQSSGDDLSYEVNTPGGYTLIDHNTNGTSITKINKKAWDFVVLQDQSLTPINYPKNTEKGATDLTQRIKRNNLNTKVMLFMTWGRKNNFDPMQTKLAETYTQVGEKLLAAVSPVGLAWQKVIQERPDIELFSGDGSHPSLQGSYLSACVFYAMFFDKNPEGLSYSAGLDQAIISYLQSIAYETVSNSSENWTAPPPLDIDLLIENIFFKVENCQLEDSVDITYQWLNRGNQASGTYQMYREIISEDLITTYADTLNLPSLAAWQEQELKLRVPFNQGTRYNIQVRLVNGKDRMISNDAATFIFYNSSPTHFADLRKEGSELKENFSPITPSSLTFAQNYWNLTGIDLSSESGQQLFEFKSAPSPDIADNFMAVALITDTVHWMNSNCIRLKGQRQYEVQFTYVNSVSPSDSAHLAFYIAKDAGTLQPTLIQDFGKIYQTDYQIYKDTISISEGETYHFLWKTGTDAESLDNSLLAPAAMAIDNFQIRLLPSTVLGERPSQDSCNNVTSVSINQRICANESYAFGSDILQQSGDYVQMFSSNSGCDSLVNLQLEVIEPIAPNISSNGDTLKANTLADAYEWYFNDRLLSTSSQTIIAEKAGIYKVRAIIHTCTSEFSSPIDFQPSLVTSIEDEIISNISLHPNPTQSFINLELPQERKYAIALLDAQGQLLYKQIHQGAVTIPVEDFNTGMYILQILNKEGKVLKTEKVIVSE